MFILDSGVMDGMACVMGDKTSCRNNVGGDGATSSDDSTAPPSGGSGSIPSASGYVWPLEPDVLKNVTVSYCWFMPSGGRPGHTGVDMPIPVGTPVLAANAGKVVQAGPGGDAGNYIMIKHSDGHWTNYQHLSRISVSVGQEVNVGQQIGLSGDGGYSTSGRPFAHLHFSVTVAETLSSRFTGAFTVDPLKYLPTTGPNISCR
jgi:murein DD-endopeptidase MepM/ murein hydrolase activator NlpD